MSTVIGRARLLVAESDKHVSTLRHTKTPIGKLDGNDTRLIPFHARDGWMPAGRAADSRSARRNWICSTLRPKSGINNKFALLISMWIDIDIDQWAPWGGYPGPSSSGPGGGGASDPLSDGQRDALSILAWSSVKGPIKPGVDHWSLLPLYWEFYTLSPSVIILMWWIRCTVCFNIAVSKILRF